MYGSPDPVTNAALTLLFFVVLGTALLMAVAFLRRWQQIRYARYVHALRREYRPLLAKLLAGERSQAGIEQLRALPPERLEILLDPIFSRRRLPSRCLVPLRDLCTEVGLVGLWQCRARHGRTGQPQAGRKSVPGIPSTGHVARAKSLRNLGILRDGASWPLLTAALDDPHHDVKFVALASLAALRAPESFPALRERLHAVAQGKERFPSVQALQAAMGNFGLSCLPDLVPSLRHQDRDIRLYAAEILHAIVCRETPRQPEASLPPEIVDLLLSELACERHSAIRASAAETLAFLNGPRATGVLRELLHDQQWFVRLRTVQALAHRRRDMAALHLDIRGGLLDPHWQVREAAIRTLISLGEKGRRQLYEHFLTSQDRVVCEQVVEVMERTGLMSALVDQYTAGTKGVDALMVEQLASEAAPLGLAGVLRTLNPDARQKFLDRFLPYAEAKTRFLGDPDFGLEQSFSMQKVLEFPAAVAV